jgi:hypothetical protein
MDYLVNLFTKGNGMFSKQLQFEVIVLSVIVVIVLTKVFKNNYGFVIILMGFVYFIANNYISVKTGALNDRNEKTLIKLQQIQNTLEKLVNDQAKILKNSSQRLTRSDLQKLYDAHRVENLYIDADMIHFIHAIIPFAEYNGQEFLMYVKGVDNILRIKKEIEEFYEANERFPENTSELFEMAIQLKSNTINNLHNFVYSIPKTLEMLKYLDDIVEKYNVLVSRDLEGIQEYYSENIKQTGIKSTTKFVSYNITKPYDQLVSPKLLNFYY